MKKNILQFFALLFTLQLVHSFQQTNVQNVTDYETGRMFGVVDHSTMERLKHNYVIAFAAAIAAVASNSGSQSEVNTDCTINVKTLENSHALIIEPFDHTQFRYPDNKGYIRLQTGSSIFLSCPGENNKLKLYPDLQSVMAMCIRETKFTTPLGGAVDFSAFTCERPPESTIVLEKNYGREGILSQYKVGFYTEKDQFLNLMNIHYDNIAKSTMYVLSVISKSIAGSQKTAKNRRFDQTYCCGDFTINMDNVYKVDTQDESFGNQMKCHKEKECSYFDKSKDIIYNRGHLTPKSTFVYTSAGIATFRYVNTAPQWKHINDGNWARIEEHITDLASKLEKDLVTITGVLGTLKLIDTADSNTEKFIFLYYEKDGLRTMPVPLYLYKLVYDPISDRGIVYVTVNNPFIKDDLEKYQICNEPMFKIPGGKVPPKWRPKFVSKGYSYICRISDFMGNNVVHFHDLGVNNVNELLYDGMIEATTDAIVVRNPDDDQPETTTVFKRVDLKRSSGNEE